jgi:hypothetical protein
MCGLAVIGGFPILQLCKMVYMDSLWRIWAMALMFIAPGCAQVIEFEQNGLKYQTLTRADVTVMFAHMPQHLRGYSMMQVAIANGSKLPCSVRPEDFGFLHQGQELQATPANTIVKMLMDRGDHEDVVKLTLAYESVLYGFNRMKFTNGYELRRQNFMSYGVSARVKAAAEASAIVLVSTKLKPGESTDGAIFFRNDAKTLTGGHIIFRVSGEVFNFNDE